MFSPATQAQLRLSRQVAAQMDNLPIGRIVDTAKQALDRDPAWMQLALNALRNIPPAPGGNVSSAAVAERMAFAMATNGDSSGARDRIAAAVEEQAEDSTRGVLLELQATYADLIDPRLAQQTLALARTKNTNVTKPLQGLTYVPLESRSPQTSTCTERLTSKYSTPAALRLDVEAIIADLIFDETRVEQFEEALRQVGLLLGLGGSQRPEHDTNGGPDNLWALGDNQFWVIEAKTGAGARPSASETWVSWRNPCFGSASATTPPRRPRLRSWCTGRSSRTRTPHHPRACES